MKLASCLPVNVRESLCDMKSDEAGLAGLAGSILPYGKVWLS